MEHYTCIIAHSIWKYQHLQTTSGKRLIRKRMKELGIMQKFLAKATSISEAKISRIMRDSTEPGDSFEWTEPDINNISIVLQWGTQGDINYEARGSPHIVLQESSRF